MTVRIPTCYLVIVAVNHCRCASICICHRRWHCVDMLKSLITKRPAVAQQAACLSRQAACIMPPAAALQPSKKATRAIADSLDLSHAGDAACSRHERMKVLPRQPMIMRACTAHMHTRKLTSIQAQIDCDAAAPLCLISTACRTSSAGIQMQHTRESQCCTLALPYSIHTAHKQTHKPTYELHTAECAAACKEYITCTSQDTHHKIHTYV